MAKRLRITLLFCIILFPYLQGQDSIHGSSIPISMSIGFPTPYTYNFRTWVIRADLNTGYFVSLGIQPWRINITSLTHVSFGFSFAYEQAFGKNWFDFEVTRKNTSLIVWSEIFVPASIQPFIRVGGGVSYHSLQEKSPDKSLLTDIKYWSPSIGVGAGISFQISQIVNCQLFSESIIILNNYRIPANGGEYYPAATVVFGIRVVLQL